MRRRFVIVSLPFMVASCASVVGMMHSARLELNVLIGLPWPLSPASRSFSYVLLSNYPRRTTANRRGKSDGIERKGQG